MGSSMKNYNSSAFILSYIELRVTPPLRFDNKVPVIEVMLSQNGVMGDTNIFIDVLSRDTEKNSVFTSGDFTFTLARDHLAGENELEVYPLTDDLEIGTEFRSAQTQQVFSINSLEKTAESQELTDRVFGESIWSTNRIANRTYKIVVSGVKIKEDTGLKYIRQSIKENVPIYFDIWVEDNPILPINGLAYVKQLQENLLVDKNVETSFELIIFKLGNIENYLVYTIGSEELDVIVGEYLGENYLLLSE